MLPAMVHASRGRAGRESAVYGFSSEGYKFHFVAISNNSTTIKRRLKSIFAHLMSHNVLGLPPMKWCIWRSHHRVALTSVQTAVEDIASVRQLETSISMQAKRRYT